MRHLLCAALLCASPSFAAPVAVFNGDTVKVYAYKDACELAAVAQVLAQIAPDAKKAAVLFDGREIQACYVVRDGQVYVIDAEGDGGTIPAAAFVEAKQA